MNIRILEMQPHFGDVMRILVEENETEVHSCDKGLYKYYILIAQQTT